MVTSRSLVTSVTLLLFVASNTTALVLHELPHNDGLRYSKRGDPMGCLDLRSQETFLWGASDGNQAALGNLTVYMPGNQENILSMERFNGMLTSVNCSETSIDMAFRDDDTFEYAKAVWDWVNGDDNHTFVMVVGRGACGWNDDHRQPFTVSSLTYDEDANVAHLAAIAQNWTEAIHTYDLNVGGMPSRDLQKRGFGEIDYNKDLALDFNHKFPVDTVTIPISDAVTATVDMSNCSTAGSFNFQFRLETVLLIPKKAEMSVHPAGVAVTVAPSLLISANITEPKTGSLTLSRINLAGIQIPAGILDIGPEIVLSVGATVGPLQGQATVDAGVVYSLDDSAVATIDIFDASAEHSGWTPKVQTTPLTVSADLSGTAKLFVKAELELAAKAFSTGFDLGVGIAPYLEADIQTVTAASGTCGASDGLALNPSYGADLILDAHSPSHGASDPLFSITLASLQEPLPDTCLPFGTAPVAAASSTTSGPAVSTSPTLSVPEIASSSSPAGVVPPSSASMSRSSVSTASFTVPLPSTLLTWPAKNPSSVTTTPTVAVISSRTVSDSSPATSSYTPSNRAYVTATVSSSSLVAVYASSTTSASVDSSPLSTSSTGRYGYGYGYGYGLAGY
ncbi:uncharacterized protein PV09_03783 [Verruconis gallopava]|uniref:Uncharacterized protein n=1 Tax=Verruconis gallopava TaxID=253628 RepID=A0A0D2AE35_9PEZI|nr:uncharacterized protein PV09_03783 [Verruconis gallopava]KIW05248.1 hypothetical protein PV09_03783 [Verruconis gallopava]